MIQTFDENLAVMFDMQDLWEHRDAGSKHRHGIVHDLVKRGKLQVVTHLVTQHGFDINVQRESDLCTPLHLAVWQQQPDVVQELLQLGADRSLRNRYGESADDLMTVQVPIRTRLQGAKTPRDILDLVDAELRNFDNIDKVTAYYRLACMSADYDAEFCNWNPHGHPTFVNQEGFLLLAQACSEVLGRRPAVAGGPDGPLWSTMMRAMAMLPNTRIIDEAVLRFDSMRHDEMLAYFESWGSTQLWQTAWGIAKCADGLRLFTVCQDALGLALSRCMSEMSLRHVSAAAWAFASSFAKAEKAARDAGGASAVTVPKPESLFHAIASVLSAGTVEFTDAQAVSNIAWSFAKVRICNETALHQLARAGLRLMPSFQDQNVANTAWAFATLGLEEHELFEALLQRADYTLYDDNHKGHVRISRTVKLAHWCQVYTAYDFCLRRGILQAVWLSNRLARDLERIRNRDFDHGLSEGSGLEAADALHELEDMLENSGEIHNDVLTGDEPADVAPEVAAGNAQAANTVFDARAGMEEVTILVLKFSRSTRAFRDALLQAPELQDCRNALSNSSLDVELPSGAKVFVRPAHYPALLQELGRRQLQLYTSHVLVAEEFEQQLMQALSRVPSSARVQLRHRDEVPVTWDRLLTHLQVNIDRTFLHVVVGSRPNSLLSGPVARTAATD